MQIAPEELKSARDRLVRANGQLAAVIRMIDEGRDCTDILNQLSAANAALSKAGFAIIATGMAKCGTDAKGTANRAELEKAFMSLA